MNGTIIRKAEDEIYIEELKEVNKKLLQDCDNLLRLKKSRNQSLKLYENSV